MLFLLVLFILFLSLCVRLLLELIFTYLQLESCLMVVSALVLLRSMPLRGFLYIFYISAICRWCNPWRILLWRGTSQLDLFPMFVCLRHSINSSSFGAISPVYSRIMAFILTKHIPSSFLLKYKLRLLNLEWKERIVQLISGALSRSIRPNVLLRYRNYY